MTFRLEIATTGALFRDDTYQEHGEAAKLTVASILRSLSTDLVADADAAIYRGDLFDSDSTQVGTWALELGEDPVADRTQ